MTSEPEDLRFVTEKSITDGLLLLMRRGIERDKLEETLVSCGPVDLDLLAKIMRHFDHASDGEDRLAGAA
ncbi:hypothetical protein [Zhengella mangrovi]|nr:hypothetical protein [Zhengella mangrovi]